MSIFQTCFRLSFLGKYKEYQSNTMSYRALFIKIVIFLLFFPYNTFADEIHLKNGDRISGQFINLSPTLCTFVTPYQATLHINRQQISQFHITHPVTIKLNFGEQLIGTLIPDQKGKLFLHSQRLGTLTLALEEITEITDLGKLTTPPLPPFYQSGEFTFSQMKIREDLFSTEKTQLLEVQGSGIKDTKSTPNEDKTEKKPETIGQKEDKSHYLLPRMNVVLLNKGEKELEVSFAYTHDQLVDQRYREFMFSLGLYTGFTDKLNGVVRLPITWAEQESLSLENFDKNSNFGIGDISAGLSYLFLEEDKQWPEIIGSLSVTAPTGDEPNLTNLNIVPLGSGHWDITTSLTLVKTYDPIALFGGPEYTYTFENTFDGVKVAPGDSLGYRFGVAFNVNYQITLTSQFLTYYQLETKHDGVKVRGSAREPMTWRTDVAYFFSKNNYIQPALSFGLNDDAIDATLELSYIHRF
jgi:hypothetical protein